MSWPDPASRAVVLSSDHGLPDAAEALERGGYDALFIDAHRNTALDPFVALAAVSSRTDRIALVAVTNPADEDPYTIARATATLDHLSGGRAGWAPSAGAHRDELIAVVRALWDSTDADGIIADKESGIYLPTGRRHTIDHEGPAFRVAGPLNVARPPQGHVPIFVPGGESSGDAGPKSVAFEEFALLPADGTAAHVFVRARVVLDNAEVGALT